MTVSVILDLGRDMLKALELKDLLYYVKGVSGARIRSLMKVY